MNNVEALIEKSNSDMLEFGKQVKYQHEMELKNKRTSRSGMTQYYTEYDQVKQFHLTMGLPVGFISDLKLDGITRRINLINEEVNEELMPVLKKVETAQGHMTLEQKVEILDAIIDACYVLKGLAVEMGLPYDTAFALVQQSNMAKIHPDGTVKRREDGKILKPDGWQPPNLFGLMNQLVTIVTAKDPHQV